MVIGVQQGWWGLSWESGRLSACPGSAATTLCAPGHPLSLSQKQRSSSSSGDCPPTPTAHWGKRLERKGGLALPGAGSEGEES